MKKIFIGLFIALAAAGIFFSCNLVLQEEKIYEKPTVKVGKAEIFVAVPYIDNTTKYINVYRKDKDENVEVSLGVLYPAAFDGSIYNFVDSYVKKDHTYSYKARYSTEDGYAYTHWSDEIKAEGGYDEAAKLSYSSSSAYLKLNESDYSLQVNGEITSPDISDFDEKFSPMMIVSNGTKTEVFKVDSIEDKAIITLRGRIPEDFLNKNITIVGITAQVISLKDKDDKNSRIENLYWLPPMEIQVQDKKNNTFVVPSLDGSDGIDYSRNVILF